MRTAVTGCGMLVLLVLLVCIHSTIVSRNVRDNEVSAALESATDYALAQMAQAYGDMDYDEAQSESYTESLLNVFCGALKELIGTDGEITVSVLQADISTGTFDLLVEESYQYAYKGRTGKSCCERAVRFKD